MVQATYTDGRGQGVKGTQVCDALTSAHAKVSRDSKELHYGIYLACDIKAAFDSIRRSALATFLLEECAPELRQESLQLLRLVFSPGQSSGVQQGGSHSAVIFAFVLL